MPLTSPQNPLLQKVRRAVETGRSLEDGTIAAEGPHLLAEALNSPWQVEHIFCSGNARDRHRALLFSALQKRIQVTEVGERAFQTISGTEQNQGVLALLKPRAFTWPDLLQSAGPLVVLDGVQDPGNAGSILRSTEAFGGAGAAVTEGSVRIANGKLLRAAAGSLFRVPYLESVRIPEVIRHIAASKRTLFSLTANGGASLAATNLTAPFALIVGSEGSGVSELLLNASQPVTIPTNGVESLNAAIACSIALFEATRQRGACSSSL